MRSEYSREFIKRFTKLQQKQQKKVREAIAEFIIEPESPSLRNHALLGEYIGHRSISAGGDLRIHFRQIDADSILFVTVGSHSQLYG
jgi:addiction module RelE/StbE family toxin